MVSHAFCDAVTLHFIAFFHKNKKKCRSKRLLSNGNSPTAPVYDKENMFCSYFAIRSGLVSAWCPSGVPCDAVTQREVTIVKSNFSL